MSVSRVSAFRALVTIALLFFLIHTRSAFAAPDWVKTAIASAEGASFTGDAKALVLFHGAEIEMKKGGNSTGRILSVEGT